MLDATERLATLLQLEGNLRLVVDLGGQGRGPLKHVVLGGVGALSNTFITVLAGQLQHEPPIIKGSRSCQYQTQSPHDQMGQTNPGDKALACCHCAVHSVEYKPVLIHVTCLLPTLANPEALNEQISTSYSVAATPNLVLR